MVNINDNIISPVILKRIAQIDWFSGAWTEGYQKKLTQDNLQTMKDAAKIETIGSSNRLSGKGLSNKGVEDVLNHVEKKTTLMLNEEGDVIGYDELLDIIYRDYQNIRLSENYIKRFNQILLKYATDDSTTAGEYQNPKAGKQLKELLDWANRTLDEGYYHPIITIGVFIANFWSISPFASGNHRLSRVLTSLLMLKYNYTYIQYDSLETLLEENNFFYKRILEETKWTIDRNNQNYDKWMDFFTNILVQNKNHMKEMVRTQIDSNELKLSTTQRTILNVFTNGYSSLTMDWIVKHAKLNKDTVRKAVRTLVKKGYLVKNGSTNRATYRKNV